MTANQQDSNWNLTVALTGASGAVFGRELLAALDADPRVAQVNFVPSESSLRVLAEELQLSGRHQLIEKLLGHASPKIAQLNESDIGAGIANGLARNLVERAADVTLKERRPLLLCVRETPFNKIHLRNMTLAADAGAVIFPVMPSFYNLPVDSTEMATQFAYRVLAHIGLPQPGAYVWKGDE